MSLGSYLHVADEHEGVDDFQVGNGRQSGLRFGVLGTQRQQGRNTQSHARWSSFRLDPERHPLDTHTHAHTPAQYIIIHQSITAFL